MDLRLERAGASLGNFLEDDLASAHFALGKDAQLHLDRFRSFLHMFYLGKHGYWPPTALGHRSTLPKSVYRSMYSEFRNLYAYLVDPTSSSSIQNNKPVDGGICVFQNLHAFDKRQKYASLPHPLPLIPKIPAHLNHSKSFGKLNVFGNKQAKINRRMGAIDALSAASNLTDGAVLDCNLVREYQRFEKQWTMMEEATISCGEARKVRWMLIYAILQTLISVTQAPREVRDTEGVSYPLCCQIAGTPPWQTGTRGRKAKPAPKPRPTSLKELLLELGPDMDIVSAKPSPLQVPPKISNVPSPPRRVSFGHNLSVKSPQPIRTTSWEILQRNFASNSSIDLHNDTPILPHDDNSPFEHSNSSPIDHDNSSPVSDPTTPSTSDAGAGSGGWSADSSEDDMDHNSVHGGSDSDYGDEEDEEQSNCTNKSKTKTLRTPSTKRYSGGSFRPGSCNPEVEQYVRS